MMTFEEFQATGRDVADVEPYAQDDEHRPGRVYVDVLYIECVSDGRMMVTIGNGGDITGRDVTLADLERMLYEFAKSEGYAS